MFRGSPYFKRLLASILRKGIIFIPAVFIMQAIIGVDGLIWAQPVADVLSLAVVIVMLIMKIRKTDFSAPGTVEDNEQCGRYSKHFAGIKTEKRCKRVS